MAGRGSFRMAAVASASALVMATGLSGLGSVTAVAAESTPVPAPRNAPVPDRARAHPTDVTPDVGTLPTSLANKVSTSKPAPKPTPKPIKNPAPKPKPPVVRATTLRPGMISREVQILQRRLVRQGFWLGASDGNYGELTGQAVMAYQKAAGLPRDGVAGPRTLKAIRKGVRLTPRSTSGHVLEIDKRRQLLLVVDRGKVTWAFNTSTGNEQWYETETGGRELAVTPTGRFRIGRQIAGWHRAPLGMLYSPKFFIRGYAIHGSTSIPGYPASHGCARLSVGAMEHLWRNKLAEIGTSVWVY